MSVSSAASPPHDALDDRVVLRHVSWDTYERLLADDEERRVPRMSYDRGLLELVSPSMGHEVDGGALALLVTIVTAALDIPTRDVGSTTFCREDLQRGFEPDYSFYIQSEERIRGQREIDLSVDAPPNLVLEMALSRSEINKVAFFASFGISEYWRCEAERVTIFALDRDDLRESATSLAIPALTNDVLTRFLIAHRTMRSPDWFRMVSDWAQATLAS